jgi:hypothetical protein
MVMELFNKKNLLSMAALPKQKLPDQKNKFQGGEWSNGKK